MAGQMAAHSAQNIWPALKVIICVGFVTKNYWQRSQGNRVEDHFRTSVLVDRHENVCLSIKLLQIPNKHTYCSHVINVGTFGSHNTPKALFLGCTVGLVQVSLSIAVHHAPFTIQHTKTVPDGKMMLSILESSVGQCRACGLGHQTALKGSIIY